MRAVEVDLHAARLPSSGRNSVYGKLEPTISSVSQLLHQLVARLGAEQADRAGDERQVVGQRRLAEQRLGDAGAEHARRPRSPRPSRAARPAPTSIATFSPAFRISAAALQVRVAAGRRAARRTPTPEWIGAVLRAAAPRRRLLLHVVRHDDAGHACARRGDAHRAVDQVPRLRGRRRHLHVLVRDVFEQRLADRLPAGSRRRATSVACWPTMATTGWWSSLAS